MRTTYDAVTSEPLCSLAESRSLQLFRSNRGIIIATETRKRTRLSPEARREQLVKIGAKLFAERPFDDVWIEEVAKAAGVSRGLVYHYFPNKRDFFSAIVGLGLRNSYEISAPDPDSPPENWITDGISKIFEYAEANANVFRAIYTSRHALDDQVLEAIKAGRELQIVRITDVITPGEEPSETLRLGMAAWAETLDHLILEWIDGRQTDREKLVRLAAGTLAGTVVTSLMIDGRGDRLGELTQLAPAIFGN